MQSLFITTLLVSLALHGNIVGGQDGSNASPQSVYQSYWSTTNKNDGPALHSTFSPTYRDSQVLCQNRWLIATNNEWKTQDEINQQADGKRMFEQLKSLEGQWRIAEPVSKTEVTFELIANGSVLVEKWRMSPTRTSMTVYSLDGDRLLVTHYCPQGNAPRLVYVTSSEKGVHRFEFLDGLNLQDAKGSHQHAFWMRFNSGDSFTRSETYIKNGEKYDASEHKDEPQTFVRTK